MAKADKKSKLSIVTVIILIIVLLAIGAFFAYGYIQKDVSGDRNTKTEYNLVIDSSDFQYDVGQKLVQNGIIKNDTIWSSWMDRHYPDFVYINGEYNVNSSMSYEQIAAKLQSPDISHKTVTVCIPEGNNVFDIAKILDSNGVCDEQEFLNACKSADGYEFDFLHAEPNTAYELEGYLFPATYDFAENSEPADVINEMLNAFNDRIVPEWENFCVENSMNFTELITLASIVEKETLGQGVAENISSVFINRLRKPMKLQSDVTIDYGNLLRKAQFNDDIVTSYNTYKCDFLPSGPICNPGVANIDAVVNYNDTDYYYFFSYNNGADFYFTHDYNDFQAQWEKLKNTNTD